MNKCSLLTARFCYWLVSVTIVYLLCLGANAPIWAAVSAIAIMTAGFIKLVRPMRSLDSGGNPSGIFMAVAALMACLVIMVWKAYGTEDKNGHWDAWWFWNMRASFLAGASYWQKAFSGAQFGSMFTVPVPHADYPPFLPLLNGLCWRILNMRSTVVPFAWSMLSLLLIPSVIFLEILSSNRLVAIAVLIFFATQDAIIRLGTGQIADLWIALFLLLACISYQAFTGSGDKRYAALTGAMLGCCLWTKNEGIILTSVFTLTVISRLVKEKAVTQFLKGIAIPAAAWLLFKLLLAPTNDILAGQTGFPWEKISDLSRYEMIRQSTWYCIQLYCPELPYILGGYFVLCALQRKAPDVLVFVLLLSMLGYLSVYVITPHNLGWHVGTSVDRLIFQLYPSLIWIVAQRLTGLKPKSLRLKRKTSSYA